MSKSVGQLIECSIASGLLSGRRPRNRQQQNAAPTTKRSARAEDEYGGIDNSDGEEYFNPEEEEEEEEIEVIPNVFAQQAAHEFSHAMEDEQDNCDEATGEDVVEEEVIFQVLAKTVKLAIRRSQRTAVIESAAASVLNMAGKKRRRSKGNRDDLFQPSKFVSEALDDAHRDLILKCLAVEEAGFKLRKMWTLMHTRNSEEDRLKINDIFAFQTLAEDELLRVNIAEAKYVRKVIDEARSAQQQAQQPQCVRCVNGTASSSNAVCVCRIFSTDQNLDPVFMEESRSSNLGAQYNPWPVVGHVRDWIEAGIADGDDSACSITEDNFKMRLNPEASEKNTTVPQFVKVMQDIASIHDLPESGILSIYKALHDHTDLCLPLRLNPSTDSLTSNVAAFTSADKRNNSVDACINQCILYVGEYETDIHCPKCYTPRYSKCNYGGTCKFGENCSPFINTTHIYRASHQTMVYRSLIIELISMCKSAVLGDPNFDINYPRRRKDGVLSDITDGAAVKEHMEDMHNQFETFKETVPHSDVKRVLEFSFVLSLFYDGDALYKRSNDSVWPLLAEVLNLHPSYRTKLGLGLFLVAMHNMTIGSGAEQSMIDNMLTEELKQGENGIQFECFDASGEAVIVYLQFRCVLFNADTKAFEKIFHVQGVGSLQGCSLCGTCHGLSRDILKARVYLSGCLHLAPDHVFRGLGEAPLPPGYFGENSERNKELGKEISDGARLVKVTSEPDAVEGQISANRTLGDKLTHPRVHSKVVGKDSTTIRKPKLGLPPGTSWVSVTTEYAHFAEAIWAPYKDDRPFQPYKRVSHEDYVQYSREAELEELDTFIKKNGKIPKSSVFTVNGVHKKLGSWVVLKAPHLTDQVPDPMHMIGNCVGYFFQLMTGDRGIDDRSRQLSLFQLRFPFLADKSIEPPWLATKQFQIFADSVFSALNIPTPYKRDYSFDLPFKHLGFMNTHQKMVFMLAFVEYFVSFTDVSLPYKRFFSRWAGDLRAIMSPMINTADLPYLENHVLETKALQELMFPDSEAAIVTHQIVDIVHHIKRMGPAEEWMCFTGERAVQQLGNCVSNGGTKYILTSSRRFVAKERAHNYLNSAFQANKEKYTDNAGYCTKMSMKMVKKHSPVGLKSSMKERLFQSVHEFLTTQEISNLVVKSSFLRMYVTYEELLRQWKTSSSPSKPARFPACLTEWVHQLYTIRHDGTPFHFARVSHLINDIVYDTINDDLKLLPLSGNETDEQLDVLADLVMRDFVNVGYLFDSDFDGIIADMAKFGITGLQPIAAFKHAVVKGVELTGRGVDCAETTLQLVNVSGTNSVGLRRNFQVTNKANFLQTNWYQFFQLNAWCKVTDYFVAQRGSVTSRVYFGQLNYFFRLFLPSDTILNGAAFANVVLRKAVFNKDRQHYRVSTVDRDSYHGDKTFISMNYIDSTAVAVNAFDNNGLPIMNPAKAMQAAQKVVTDWPLKLSPQHAEDAVYLDMIELHKERMHLNYDSIEFDTDNTKYFEGSVLKHYQDAAAVIDA